MLKVNCLIFRKLMIISNVSNLRKYRNNKKDLKVYFRPQRQKKLISEKVSEKVCLVTVDIGGLQEWSDLNSILGRW